MSKRSTYEVRVIIEVVNNNQKSHRQGYSIKRREFVSGQFAKGERDAAKSYANDLITAVKAVS